MLAITVVVAHEARSLGAPVIYSSKQACTYRNRAATVCVGLYETTRKRDAVRKGNDFPTIWNSLLKRHPLVEGIPQQRFEGNRSFLDIRLITGERLVFESEGKRFSVE